MTLALFDFDGTITSKDTFIEFIKFCVGDFRFYLGFFILSPVLVAYKLKLLANYKAKEIVISYFFKGYEKEEFEKLAQEYSLNHISKILRRNAIEKLTWHKLNSHKVVVVSASIDFWVEPWCKKNDIEFIGTRLEIIDGKLSGKIKGKNCFGEEKVIRIKEKFDLKNFKTIYAYGDSSGDKQMLELAQKAYYKPFE